MSMQRCIMGMVHRTHQYIGKILRPKRDYSHEDLKNHLFAHQARQVARQWLSKYTRKALFNAQLVIATHNGVDTKCVKPSNHKTINIYHFTLVSIPEVMCQSSNYKSKQDVDMRLLCSPCYPTLLGYSMFQL